jgi:hypothetical protein
MAAVDDDRVRFWDSMLGDILITPLRWSALLALTTLGGFLGARFV